MRNWMMVPVSFDLWRQMVTEGNVIAARCTVGLPEDAVFIRAWYDPNGRGTVNFVFEHPSFDEVPESGAVPKMGVEFEHLVTTEFITYMEAVIDRLKVLIE